MAQAGSGYFTSFATAHTAAPINAPGAPSQIRHAPAGRSHYNHVHAASRQPHRERLNS